MGRGEPAKLPDNVKSPCINELVKCTLSPLLTFLHSFGSRYISLRINHKTSLWSFLARLAQTRANAMFLRCNVK